MNKPKAKKLNTQFYFQGTAELRELTDELRGRENAEFAAFVRSTYYAGLNAKYGINIINNKPILQDTAATM